MIQHTVRVLCAFIVLTISISAQKQPNFAPDAYKKLANLAGNWVGKDQQGEEVKSNFKLAISNTAVTETLNATGMEEMLTLYSVDGDGISLLHYCLPQVDPFGWHTRSVAARPGRRWISQVP
jgi:hypothetical protein